MAKLESLIVDLQVQNAQLKAGLDQANAKLDGFGRKVDKIGKGMQIAFGLAIARQVGAFMASLVVGSAEAADKLTKLSRAVGVTVEELSRINYAAGFAGVGTDELGGSLNKLNKTLGDAVGGSKTAADTFAGLGINILNTNGTLKNADHIMFEVADKFKGMEDGAAKAAIAQDLFGRSGAKMINLLNGGSEGFRAAAAEADKFGITLSTKAGMEAERFNDSLARIHRVADGMAIQLSAVIVPAITELAEAFTDTAKNGDAVKEVGKAIGVAMKVAASALILVVAELKQVGSAINTIISAAGLAAQGNFADAARAVQTGTDEMIADQTEAVKRINKLWSSTDAFVGEKGPMGQAAPKGSGTGMIGGAKGLTLEIGNITDFKDGNALQLEANARLAVLTNVMADLDQTFNTTASAWKSRFDDARTLRTGSLGGGEQGTDITGSLGGRRVDFGGASAAQGKAPDQFWLQVDKGFASAKSALQPTMDAVNAALSGFGGALAMVGRSVLSKLGAVGNAVGGAVDRLMEGDVWGAIGAFFSNIITNLKSFEPLVNIAQGILLAVAPMFDMLMLALKPLLGSVGRLLEIVIGAIAPVFDALAPALEALAPSLVIVAKLVGAVLAPVAKLLASVLKVLADVFQMVLFPVIKVVAQIILEVLKALVGVWNGIVDAVSGILRWLSNIEILGAKPFGFLNDWANAVNKAKATTGAFDAAMADLNATTFDSAKAEVVDATANFESAGAADKASDAMDKVTESLTNIPRWFKVASERWTAAAGPGGSAGLQSAPVNVFVGGEQVASVVERELEVRNWRRGRMG